jgi:hypothetical protein
MELEYSTMSSEGSSVGSELSQESTRLEEFHIEGVRLQLPQGLCENKNIFKEFFSHRTWQECFTEHQKQHLKVNRESHIKKCVGIVNCQSYGVIFVQTVKCKPNTNLTIYMLRLCC